MSPYLLRNRQICTHEHCRPDERMESYDLLTYQMAVARPVFIELLTVVRSAQSCNIIRESIDPYIHDVLRIVRYRNSPIERRTGNTEIFHTLLYKSYHLIASCLRYQEVRVFPELLKKSVGIF